MNKSQLADAIAKDTGITKAQAMSAVDSVVGNITDALKSDDKVVLVGFGTFSTSERAAREGRNPLTGAPLKIPARKVAKFVPGKALKDAIN
jgi:DNA-binding protein HU-beta